MRARTVLLIIGIVLLAAFAFLNVAEFTRSSLLSLGFTTIQLPLGLLMLLLLVAVMLVFLTTTLYLHQASLIETRNHTRELNIQRELADKAEASRFTELRNYIQAQTNATLQREAANATVLTERLAQVQAALVQRIEQSDNTTAAHMGQLEDRLERDAGLIQVR